MPGTAEVPEIELTIEDLGNGGGKPPTGGDDGDGDGGGDDDKRRRRDSPSPKRYSTAITIALVSILMFFMALASAFIVLRRGSDAWVTVHLPPILWANTIILIASSFTLEAARRRLSESNASGFRKLWLLTTGLGILFVTGQFVAWRQLVSQGVFLASNQASSFFYIFTGAHAAHLLGGVAALLYVSFRKLDTAKVSVPALAEIASYYWHFMDGLWVFLLAVLYLGK
jgi:cytochrome c oxidase subunit 3